MVEGGSGVVRKALPENVVTLMIINRFGAGNVGSGTSIPIPSPRPRPCPPEAPVGIDGSVSGAPRKGRNKGSTNDWKLNAGMDNGSTCG